MASWLAELIGVVVPITVALVAFEVGTNSASSAVWALVLRRRALFLRSLFGVLVLVPLLAVALAKAAVLPDVIGAGILVTAISVGPVAAIEKSETPGAKRSFALGLNMLLLGLSLVYVPLAVWVMDQLLRRATDLSVATVAGMILPLQLLPLVAGVAVGRLAPKFAARTARPLAVATNVILGAILVLVLVLSFGPLSAIGLRGLIVVAALGVSAVLIGHVLGGPDVNDRKVLASFMAVRFPTLALALAQLSVHGRDAVPSVIAYLIGGGLAYSLYLTLLTHLGKRAHHPADSRPRSLRAS